MSSQRVVLVACGCFNPITNMHLRLFELAKDALHKTGRYRVLAGLVSPASDNYKKAGLLSAQHRCTMIRLATASSDWIRLHNWESQQTEWTRTAMVMRRMTEIVRTADKLAMSGDQHTQSKRQKRADGREVDTDPDSIEDWLQQVIRSDAVTSGLDEENNDTGSAQRTEIDIKLVCGSDLLESMGVPNLWSPEDMEYIVGERGIVVINRPGSDARKFIYETDILAKHEAIKFPKENIHVVTEWMVSDVSATKVRRAIRRGESVKYILHDDVIAYIRKHSLFLAPSAATTPCPEKKSEDK